MKKFKLEVGEATMVSFLVELVEKVKAGTASVYSISSSPAGRGEVGKKTRFWVEHMVRISEPTKRPKKIKK